jgi:hypothetical protein
MVDAEYQRIWREQHKHKVSEYNKSYRKRHPELVRKRSREYYASHREKCLRNSKQWRKEHQKNVAEYNKRWRETHLGQRDSEGKNYILKVKFKRRQPSSGKCESCRRKAGRLQYHHWMKSKPEIGIWLCNRCHMTIEALERGYYNRYFSLRNSLTSGKIRIVTF